MDDSYTLTMRVTIDKYVRIVKRKLLHHTLHLIKTFYKFGKTQHNFPLLYDHLYITGYFKRFFYTPEMYP